MLFWKAMSGDLFKRIYKLHIYIGLYCSVYFIIIGITGLNFQHHFLKQEAKFDQEYTQKIELDTLLSRNELITACIAELDLYGGVIWWKVWENKSQQSIHFELVRPGRNHKICIYKGSSSVSVKTYKLGIGSVLGGLHYGSAGDPDSILFKIWKGYVHSLAVLGLLLIISSIYFWFRKSIRHKWQWMTVLVSGSLSIILILLVWLVG